jgi:phage recombination protein Bet
LRKFGLGSTPNVSQFPSSNDGVQSAQVPDQKIQKETILEYIRVYGFDKTLTGAEQNQFIQTALAGDLNPFKREIHLAVYGEGENRKVSMLTGYQVYLKRAERTGNLDGWRAWLEGEGPQMKAIVEIFRKDWSHSFTHEVYWEESVQKKKDGNPTQFWAKQPRFQLRKVAIAQGFRLAFPDELGSLPYESAELPGDENAAPNVSSSAIANGVKTSNQTSALAEQALGNDDRVNNAPTGQEGTNTATAPRRQEPGNDDETRDKLIKRIENLFDTHPRDFTKKHMDWILNTAHKSADNSGILKMIAYTEKVIKKASA